MSIFVQWFYPQHSKQLAEHFEETNPSWWFQPLWKIWPSKWEPSPRFGVNIKKCMKTTTLNPWCYLRHRGHRQNPGVAPQTVAMLTLASSDSHRLAGGWPVLPGNPNPPVGWMKWLDTWLEGLGRPKNQWFLASPKDFYRKKLLIEGITWDN